MLIVSWFLLLLARFSCADIVFSDFAAEKDQCKEICADSFFVLPKVVDSTTICQRGCRFFNIIYLKDDHDVNITKDECFMSCNEAYYNVDKRESCNVGCNTMSKKKQNELSNVLVFIEQDNPKNFIIAEPELELLEFEFLSDPNIQSQLEYGYNVEYKIPEAKIRTMPIEQMLEYNYNIQKQTPSNDWLDCASRNSGIPKWVLLTAILSAVLIALGLSISSEKKSESENEDTNIINAIKNDLLSQVNIGDKEPLIDDQLESVEFSDPSKFSMDEQKV